MIGWRPLLQGEEAARAWSVIGEIADVLAATQPDHPGLDGASGLALFFSYLGATRGDEHAVLHATQLLEYAALKVVETPHDVSLYNGLAGVGWTLQHLAPTDLEDPDDPNLAFDAAIAEAVAGESWNGRYDLISGLAGLAVYALERLPRPSARITLERIVGHIERLAEPAPNGVTWHTKPELLVELKRTSAPNGMYDLGLAHGVPGLINTLARIVAAGIAVDRARPLLEGAVTWILAQRLHGMDARFAGSKTGSPADAIPARSAWCYGDPGVAAALLGAGRKAAEPEWEASAVDLLLGAARRAFDRCGVVDAGLCHGAAGLAEIFMRAYHATGKAELSDAARTWLSRVFAVRRRDVPLAGFPAFVSGAWKPDASLTTGIVGIGLALLAAVSEMEPGWDTLLLLDL